MEINMVDITCPNCGIVFAITKIHDYNLRNSHNSFYCPSGHRMSYAGKSEEEKLREKLADRESSLKYLQDKEQSRLDGLRKKRKARLKKQKVMKSKK